MEYCIKSYIEPEFIDTPYLKTIIKDIFSQAQVLAKKCHKDIHNIIKDHLDIHSGQFLLINGQIRCIDAFYIKNQ